MNRPRILCWDIESSQLHADFGGIFCVGYKWVGEPMKTTKVISTQDINGACKCCKRIVNPLDDKGLLERLYPILAEADGWLTWFGEFFDEKFVNTRLIAHHLPPLPPVFHIDGWRTAKYKLRLSSNRLKSVQAFLDLPESKTALLPKAWIGALNGDTDSMGYLIDHCRRDVVVLEQAYARLKPLITKHPNFNLFNGTVRELCPNCGAKVQYRGTHYTPTRTYQRFQCRNCGKWGRLSKSTKVTQVIGL